MFAQLAGNRDEFLAVPQNFSSPFEPKATSGEGIYDVDLDIRVRRHVSDRPRRCDIRKDDVIIVPDAERFLW